MTLDVQWFIYALVQNEIVLLEDAVALYDSLGENNELGDYAQAVLDQLAAQLSPEDAQSMLEQFESVLQYARTQADRRAVPDMEFPKKKLKGPTFAAPKAPQVPQTPQAPQAPKAPPANRAPAPIPAATPSAREEAPGPGSEIRVMPPEGTGTSEDISLEAEPMPGFENLPSLRNVSQLNNQALADLMVTLLTQLRALGASDLHISAGARPFIRRALKIERFSDWIVPEDDAERLNKVLMTQEQIERFDKDMDINLSLEIGENRFRVALMMHKTGISGCYRLVPESIRSLEELSFLPGDVKTIEKLLDYHNGLILVTGPIGSGKTTTLAAMIDVINQKRQDHVITVEDPIEILQWSKNCQITQREVGKHTNSYRSALKGALREDPDIIVIGEMHDLETIENAITASETGHLVIGTLHTCDAANTLNRMLDVFPPGQQPQIRAMTGGSLRGIICQRLVPATDGTLTLGYEILINTMAVSSTITEGKIHQLKAAMAIGSKSGMCTMDQNLFEKFQLGLISAETALTYMRDSSVIDQLNRAVAVSEAKKLAAEAAALAAKK